MKIGLYIRLLGQPGTEPPPPGWPAIREQAQSAEDAGFDLVVFEDALFYEDEPHPVGVWESVSMVAAVAASTSKIGIGHAVMNSPYRAPALAAKIATTLDEISDGRYVFGIGLGNTPDDYPRFGIDADPRYSRFAEAIRIIHDMLKTGRTDFEGTYYRAPGAELVLRGPRPQGPPIAIAAGKPRALRLVAQYADEWNWWVGERDDAGLRAAIDELERACAELGRDPATLRRSLDVFSVALGDGHDDADSDGTALLIHGSPEVIADALLAYAKLGFSEVRINLEAPDGMPRPEAIGSMREVVERVHAG